MRVVLLFSRVPDESELETSKGREREKCTTVYFSCIVGKDPCSSVNTRGGAIVLILLEGQLIIICHSKHLCSYFSKSSVCIVFVDVLFKLNFVFRNFSSQGEKTEEQQIKKIQQSLLIVAILIQSTTESLGLPIASLLI